MRSSQLRNTYVDNSQMMMAEQLAMYKKHYQGDLKKRLELKPITCLGNTQEWEESKCIPKSHLKRERGKQSWSRVLMEGNNCYLAFM